MKIGLRIDVDTLRGTKHGVPRLCKVLADHGIVGSFFFSVGPDNMGRHLWRLVRPRFFLKMVRTRAASLYGWDILLRGTFWPGPVIGRRLAPVIRAVADAGHEVGLHAWDHHQWQTEIDRMTDEAIHRSIDQGMALLREVLGRLPVSSAAPAWKCNDLVLLEKTRFPFTYNSDCRGHGIFYPVVRGKPIPQPQIPATLPTYDELIGRNGISEKTYNDYLISLLRPEGLNVLTIHAEAEGMTCLRMFDRFLRMVRSGGRTMVPLGELLMDAHHIQQGVMVPREIPGREGWVSCQGEAPQEVLS
ncbi:MAG: undecaprenyl phosphate-alpha-L-ara4FN deformylase [Thermodesulfobacteriota bacterium]|nr:undecaprenyl phosphate-alpha-L-ara4FN deformylase [Thermodesulfobacteriota bacterium]